MQAIGQVVWNVIENFAFQAEVHYQLGVRVQTEWFF
jgi:hypothetical protein